MKAATGLASLFFLLSGCGGGGGSATLTPKFVNSGGARYSMATFLTPFQRWIEPTTPLDGWGRVTNQVGQTTATSITSLQYYIQSIQLCERITVVGSGYSNSSGCSNVYVNAASQDVATYNNYTVTSAIADTDPTHFIDFLSPTSRATLEQAAAVDARTYNYALINFMRPIKMTAEFKNGTGTTIHYTKTTTAGMIVDGGTDSGGRKIEYVRPNGATKTGPAQLMTYMLNNGGAWFPFVTPFVVNKGDSVLLDFVFNPANFATTSEVSGTCGAPSNNPAVFDQSNCVSFDLPYAKMTPVPRKAGESTRKEVYTSQYITAGAQKSNLRIELYYNSADTAKSIRGVDIAVVMDPSASNGIGNIVGTYGVTETSNVVTLKGYNPATGNNDAETLNNLTRRVSGTLNIKCVFAGGPCATADGSAMPMPYTFVGDVAIN